MKAIHNKPLKKELPLVQWLTEARQLESKDRNAAINEYKQIALVFPSDERAFNRLMVLFRQMRKPKDELYWINKAISSFQSTSAAFTCRLMNRSALLLLAMAAR